MGKPTVVILAAGLGTRMRSALPKGLHPLCGRPLLLWPVMAALESGSEQVIVVDSPTGTLAEMLSEGVTSVVQPEPDGTGGALRAALPVIEDASAPVVVLSGDVPLVTAELIVELVAVHEGSGVAATVATVELENPTGYGRVVRTADGTVERIVETKQPGDATAQQLAIREVNAGIYVFSGGEGLAEAVAQVGSDNAQNEYYLPDVLPLLRDRGGAIAAYPLSDPTVALGVNDRSDLAVIRAHAQRRIHERQMAAGVTITDPAQTVIDVEVGIGPDTVIEPGVALRGATTVGARCVIGPHTTVIDSRLGDEVTAPHSYLDSAVAASGARIGPFAYLRPGADLAERAKAGTFVEIKNSKVGPGAKVPHLSYIGDADIGEGTNLGAGTITANYDGRNKHRTVIGARVRGGVDTSFVAPVTVGDDAYTAAGSVVTEDVPPGALAVARERQQNIEDYAERKVEKKSS